jgi:HPt (histidine-containing phosphotransfer) domain-containing protein
MHHHAGTPGSPAAHGDHQVAAGSAGDSGSAAGAGLASELGEEGYAAVLDEFMVHLPDQVTDLRAAAAVGDAPLARYVAHQLAGTALEFGAAELNDLAHRILQIGRGDDTLLRSVVDLIGTEVDRLQAAHHPRDPGSLESDIGSLAYAELLDEFITRLPRQVVSLKAAAATGDLPWARYVGHELMGTARDFGAPDLDHLARRLLTVDQDRPDLLREVVLAIDEEASRLETAHGSGDSRELSSGAG